MWALECSNRLDSIFSAGIKDLQLILLDFSEIFLVWLAGLELSQSRLIGKVHNSGKGKGFHRKSDKKGYSGGGGAAKSDLKKN